MTKVSRKTNIENINIQNKPPKKESGLTKLFHSVVKTFGIESWFHKEPVATRKIEILPKDEDEVEMEDLLGPKEEKPEVSLIINETVVQDIIKVPNKEQQMEIIREEIDVLRERSAELEQLIFDVEATDPWGLRGMVERVFGKDQLTTLKEDQEIIDKLIKTKTNKLTELIEEEQGDLDGLEFDEHSDDEVNL